MKEFIHIINNGAYDLNAFLNINLAFLYTWFKVFQKKPASCCQNAGLFSGKKPSVLSQKNLFDKIWAPDWFSNPPSRTCRNPRKGHLGPPSPVQVTLFG